MTCGSVVFELAGSVDKIISIEASCASVVCVDRLAVGKRFDTVAKVQHVALVARKTEVIASNILAEWIGGNASLTEGIIVIARVAFAAEGKRTVNFFAVWISVIGGG